MDTGEKREKIGVYGGTFNPIHNGHLRLAAAWADHLGLDRLLLIPTNIPPHKRAPALAPGRDRLEMCRLAGQLLHSRTGVPVEVSDMELRREGPSYTVDTLTELHRQIEAEGRRGELYLIMGGDMLLTLDRWRAPREIGRLAVICGSARQREEYRLLERQAQVLEEMGIPTRLLQLEVLELSSTQLRRRAEEGGSLAGLVPEPVAAYIARRGLYRSAGAPLP